MRRNPGWGRPGFAAGNPVADERAEFRRSNGANAAVLDSPRLVSDVTASVIFASKRASAPADALARPCQSASGPAPFTDNATGAPSVRPSRRSSRMPVGSAASSRRLRTGVAPASSTANRTLPADPSNRYQLRSSRGVGFASPSPRPRPDNHGPARRDARGLFVRLFLPPHHNHCRAAGWATRFTKLLPALKLVKPSSSPPYSMANPSTR